MNKLVQHGAPPRQGENGCPIAIVASTVWPFVVRVSVDPMLSTAEGMRSLGRKIKRKLLGVLAKQLRRIAAAGKSGAVMPHGYERFAFDSGRAEYGFRIDPQVVTPTAFKQLWRTMADMLLKLLPIQQHLAGGVAA